jgi:hypothetical protein
MRLVLPYATSLLFLCGACATAPQAAPAVVHKRTTPPPPPVVEPIKTESVELLSAPEPMPQKCEPPARETCNALDDDCNGVIDDNCGYKTGGVQITVGWNSGADIDLYVTDPSGETIFYNEQHDHSSAGGQLDHNARGDCRRQRHPRIENAYWPEPAPIGRYRIELHYFGPCEKSNQTDAHVSVSVRGKLLGSYSYTLKPEQRVYALAFEVR